MNQRKKLYMGAVISGIIVIRAKATKRMVQQAEELGAAESLVWDTAVKLK